VTASEVEEGPAVEPGALLLHAVLEALEALEQVVE
jgi:hypothetical protein